MWETSSINNQTWIYYDIIIKQYNINNNSSKLFFDNGEGNGVFS